MGFFDDVEAMDAEIFANLGAVSVSIATRDGNNSGTVTCISNDDRKERTEIGSEGVEETWTDDLSFRVSDVVGALGRRFLTGDSITYKGQVLRVVTITEDDGCLYVTAEIIKRLATYGNPESKR